MSEHVPVLVQEVLEILNPEPGNTLLDATLGHGGHAKAYLDAAEGTHVKGFDADAKALQAAKEHLVAYEGRVTYINANFANIGQHLKEKVNCVLFDLGIGSHQLSDQERGFSFVSEGVLTMRYGDTDDLPSSSDKALAGLERMLGHPPDVQEILHGIAEVDLAHIIREYGEERYAGRIARVLKAARNIHTGRDLAQAVSSAVPTGYEHGRIHPATRTFQALRIAVNRELDALAEGLTEATHVLVPGGVIAVISFHSLEDRIVKQFFQKNKKQFEILTKKPIRASKAEISVNPRSRSARLRAARVP